MSELKTKVYDNPWRRHEARPVTAMVFTGTFAQHEHFPDKGAARRWVNQQRKARNA